MVPECNGTFLGDQPCPSQMSFHFGNPPTTLSWARWLQIIPEILETHSILICLITHQDLVAFWYKYCYKWQSAMSPDPPPSWSLSVDFDGCGAWCLVLREGHRLGVFQNRVLRKISWPNSKQQETGENCIMKNLVICTSHWIWGIC